MEAYRAMLHSSSWPLLAAAAVAAWVATAVGVVSGRFFVVSDILLLGQVAVGECGLMFDSRHNNISLQQRNTGK